MLSNLLDRFTNRRQLHFYRSQYEEAKKKLTARDITLREMRRRMQECVDSNDFRTCSYILKRTLEETKPLSATDLMTLFSNQVFEQSKGRPADIKPAKG